MDALARAAAAGLPGSPELREALPAPLPSAPAPAHAPELGRRLVALEGALVRPDPHGGGRRRRRGERRPGGKHASRNCSSYDHDRSVMTP